MHRSTRYLALVAALSIPLIVAAMLGKLAWQTDDPSYRATQHAYRNPPAPRILLLGDSVIFTAGPCDRDKRSVGEFLAETLGEPVQTLAHPANTPLVFTEQLRFLTNSPTRPEILIVPLNLRWLSVHWGDNPAYRFTLRRTWLTLADGALPAVAQWPSLVHQLLGAGHPQQVLAWQQREVTTDWGQPLGKVIALEQGQPNRDLDCAAAPPLNEESKLLAAQYAYHYASPPQNPAELIAALPALHRRANALGLRVLYYLTPIDAEAIALHGDPRIHAALERRKAQLRDTLSSLGAQLLDLSETLPHQRFIDRRYACEHLDDIGRKQLAQTLAKHLPSSNM